MNPPLATADNGDQDQYESWPSLPEGT